MGEIRDTMATAVLSAMNAATPMQRHAIQAAAMRVETVLRGDDPRIATAAVAVVMAALLDGFVKSSERARR